MQGNYHEYIDLYNEAAKLNGFVDASMMKVDPYESKTFIQEMENTWQVGKMIRGKKQKKRIILGHHTDKNIV